VKNVPSILPEAEISVEQWLAIRKEEALRIDPTTAEVTWWYTQVLDPYGVEPDLPEDCHCVGRGYFACSPGSDIWVWFGDLPKKTQHELWEKHKSKLAFPAGLEAVAELLKKEYPDRRFPLLEGLSLTNTSEEADTHSETQGPTTDEEFFKAYGD
jgi:hypothetical protein